MFRVRVPRNLLPIVEGTTVNTKHGPVKSDHVLFIAAGDFHRSKPSDLMPELQGRFPIRVDVHDLTRDDFARILAKPRTSLLRQSTRRPAGREEMAAWNSPTRPSRRRWRDPGVPPRRSRNPNVSRCGSSHDTLEPQAWRPQAGRSDHPPAPSSSTRPSSASGWRRCRRMKT